MLDRPNSDNPLGMRLSEELGTHCDPSTCCKATGFHSYCVCQAAGFQRYYKAGKRRTGAGYDATELVILMLASLWLVSRFLKKLILAIFAIVFIAFMLGHIYKGPQSTMLEVPPQLLYV